MDDYGTCDEASGLHGGSGELREQLFRDVREVRKLYEQMTDGLHRNQRPTLRRALAMLPNERAKSIERMLEPHLRSNTGPGLTGGRFFVAQDVGVALVALEDEVRLSLGDEAEADGVQHVQLGDQTEVEEQSDPTKKGERAQPTPRSTAQERAVALLVMELKAQRTDCLGWQMTEWASHTRVGTSPGNLSKTKAPVFRALLANAQAGERTGDVIAKAHALADGLREVQS